MVGLAMLAGCVAPDQRPVVPVPANPVGVEPPAEPLDASRFTLAGMLIQGGVATGTVPPGTATLTLDGRPVAIATGGRFLIAFDRDAGGEATLVAMAAGGRALTRKLSIARREWAIERLNSLPRFAQSDAAMAALRPPELAAIAAARAMETGAQGWRQRFIWPVTGRVSGLFGAQRIYANGEAGDYHSGVDIAQPAGTPVAAPADGVVILAADHPFTLEGNLLMIDHGMGLNSAFLHLSRIDVRVGQHVRQGEIVGAVGMTGRATGPHLHWGMKWQNARIDPAALAGEMRGGLAPLR